MTLTDGDENGPDTILYFLFQEQTLKNTQNVIGRIVDSGTDCQIEKKKILKPRLLLKVETDEINYVSVLL